MVHKKRTDFGDLCAFCAFLRMIATNQRFDAVHQILTHGSMGRECKSRHSDFVWIVPPLIADTAIDTIMSVTVSVLCKNIPKQARKTFPYILVPNCGK